MQIYLHLNGQQVGPYTTEQLQEYLDHGQVAPETPAWHEGLHEWSTADALAADEVSEEIQIPDSTVPASKGEGEVILHVQHQADYSRGELILRALFGWLYIGIPHGICLNILGIAWAFCSVVAWFAILFTGNHPEGLYNFVNLTKQWQVRVAASLLHLVDGYPSFGLGNKGDKVNYLINRPSTFSRGKCLLRLLSLIYVIIPHGICLYLRMVISGVLAFVMFWVVLFTGRYPAGIHEFQVGTLRWAMRVAAYLSMMSDKYPPFSGKH